MTGQTGGSFRAGYCAACFSSHVSPSGTFSFFDLSVPYHEIGIPKRKKHDVLCEKKVVVATEMNSIGAALVLYVRGWLLPIHIGEQGASERKRRLATRPAVGTRGSKK